MIETYLATMTTYAMYRNRQSLRRFMFKTLHSHTSQPAESTGTKPLGINRSQLGDVSVGLKFEPPHFGSIFAFG